MGYHKMDRVFMHSNVRSNPPAVPKLHHILSPRQPLVTHLKVLQDHANTFQPTGLAHGPRSLLHIVVAVQPVKQIGIHHVRGLEEDALGLV